MDIQISANFKKQVRRTLLSIVIFIVVYILLFLSSIALVALSIYAGVAVMKMKFGLMTLAIGLALIGTSLTVLYFMIKFIFAKKSEDFSDQIEVTESDQPELFELIRSIATEVGTQFPKHVYLTPYVNASVFYDSTFWSMIFPTRKNLQIGIGLINSLTQQELKAILAHEFGHFAQRSMKVGSYVYIVNKVLFNLLYNDMTLEKMQNRIGSTSWLLSFAMTLSGIFIDGIQSILRRLYNFININYMSLSREMEFHADAIATHVAGSEAMRNGLLRLSFADYAFQETIRYYQQISDQNIVPQNFFAAHAATLILLSERHNLNLIHNFPQLTLANKTRFDKSKLIVEDLWASHPTEEARTSAIDALNIRVDQVSNKPANDLLRLDENLANRVFQILFAESQYQGPTYQQEVSDFVTAYKQEFERYQIPKIYNEFYNYHQPYISKFTADAFQGELLPLDVLFSDEHVNLTFEIQALTQDKYYLEAVYRGEIKLRRFDYDGVRYKNKQVNKVVQQINAELKEKRAYLEDLNRKIFQTFYQMGKKTGKEFLLREAYNVFAMYEEEFEKRMKFYYALKEDTQFIFQHTEFPMIISNLQKLNPSIQKLKMELKDFLEIKAYRDSLTKESFDDLTNFLTNENEIFAGNTYNDEAITQLFIGIGEYWNALNITHVDSKVHLLRLQEEIYDEFISAKKVN